MTVNRPFASFFLILTACSNPDSTPDGGELADAAPDDTRSDAIGTLDGGNDGGGDVPMVDLGEIAFIELSVEGVTDDRNVRPLGFSPSRLEVHGVRSDASSIELTGRPELRWQVSPPSRAEVDAGRSLLVGLEPGIAQVRVELMAGDALLTDSQTVEFVPVTIERVVLVAEEVPSREVGVGAQDSVEMVEGWAFHLAFRAYLSGGSFATVSIPLDRTVITLDSSAFTLTRSEGVARLVADSPGEASLNVTVNTTGGEPLWTGEFTTKSWAREELELLEPWLLVSINPAAIGESVRFTSEMRMTPIGETRRNFALSPSLAAWEVPASLFADLECSRFSCIGEATGEGTGLARYQMMLGEASIQAEAVIEVFDEGAISVELDPPNLNVGQGTDYCMADLWSLRVVGSGGADALRLDDPEVVVEEVSSDDTFQISTSCKRAPFSSSPRTLIVTYRRQTATGQINFL